MSDQIVGPLAKPEHMRREEAFKNKALDSLELMQRAFARESRAEARMYQDELSGMLIAAEALEELGLAAWLQKLLEQEGL